MIRIGLIGSESMHARAFAQACNVADKDGVYQVPGAKVAAVYGVDDTAAHTAAVQAEGKIPLCVNSLQELSEHCDAFMVLTRRGSAHIPYVSEIIKSGAPVFINKPVCSSYEEIEQLRGLAAQSRSLICGGSAMKYCRQVRQMKKMIEKGKAGQIRGGTINHSADMDSVYDGIFFYLPHAVEMMLELFGYAPKSLRTTVLSHDNFSVCVKYEDCLVNLVLNGAAPSYIMLCGKESIVRKVDDRDIFAETMRDFVGRIRKGERTSDVERLVKSIQVILAVQKSIETGRETAVCT